MNSSTGAKITVGIVALCFVLFAAFVLNNTAFVDPPSKKELVASLYSKFGDSDGQSRKYYQCVMDKTYNKLSNQTLVALNKADRSDDGSYLSDFGSTYTEISLLSDASFDCDESYDDTDNYEADSFQNDATDMLYTASSDASSLQYNNGTDNFAGITVDSLSEYSSNAYTTEPLAKSEIDKVAILQIADDTIIFQSRSEEDGTCYFLELSADGSEHRGTADIQEGETCPSTQQSDGWPN